MNLLDSSGKPIDIRDPNEALSTAELDMVKLLRKHIRLIDLKREGDQVVYQVATSKHLITAFNFMAMVLKSPQKACHILYAPEILSLTNADLTAQGPVFQQIAQLAEEESAKVKQKDEHSDEPVPS